MKFITTHLSETALVVCAIIGLILILGNMTYTLPDGTKKTGFNAILGNEVPTNSENYAGYQDDDTLQRELSVDKPKIDYTPGQSAMKAGVEIPILDYFNVTYGNGDIRKASDVPEIKIIEILDQKKDSILSTYNVSQKKLMFPTAGIYTFKLYIRDQENRETTVQIKIPVGGGI